MNHSGASEFGAWNPGIQSQIPRELLDLATIFRPAHVFTGSAAALELQGLTGLPLTELVAFRPERLALHELLIRVTADFVVPDGSRIGDLGINFRHITSRLMERYVTPRLPDLTRVYDDARRELARGIEAALDAVPGLGASPPAVAVAAPAPGFLSRLMARVRGTAVPGTAAPAAPRRQPGAASSAERDWGPAQIDQLAAMAHGGGEAVHQLACLTLSRVLGALFKTHGQAWGTRELIVSVSLDVASNVHCGAAIGRSLDPLLRSAAAQEGYRLLPSQERPVVINTKGASASGKSTLRPLQKELAHDIGVNWEDFALISPDIWRKQLLDYASLGAAYKYAGAFTADEVQIVDQKLDHYMADKHRRGAMSHLLIDRFRFDSFAPDSDEAGSNLLTRFGETVYLFFVITPPDLLVERAWKRGLEFGRYKAVDDTLGHSVEANAGIPDMFFTWARRGDKQLRFEFLDNTVPFGERPRTVAFGDNQTFNVLDPGCLSNIQRYGRIDVDALAPHLLYPATVQLAPEHNTAFLQRCVREFGRVNFAEQDSGRIYLRIHAGRPVWVDAPVLRRAAARADTLAAIRATAPEALDERTATAAAGAPAADAPQFLGEEPVHPTLGQWGGRRAAAG